MARQARASDPAADRCFLEAAYVDLLGRPPTTAEVTSWQARLAAGTSRTQVALELARTQEWARVVVTGLYQQVLGRPTDPGGREFWAARLVAGERTADLAAQLYASNEFYREAGGTNRAYVAEVYRNILQREADAAGLAYWVGRLDGGAPRTTIARQFFLTIESNGRRVDALYRRLLGRASEAAGRAYWAERLVTEDDIALAGLLVGSAEYYRLAQVGSPISTTTTTSKPSTTTTSTSSTTSSTTSTTTSSTTTTAPASTTTTTTTP